MFNTIIFDLDDTLISEYDYIKSGFYYISEILSIKYNLNKCQLYNKLIYLFSKNTKNVFNNILEYFHIPYKNEDILALVKLYRNHIPNIRYYDDVIPCIGYLRKKQIQLGIITDGYNETQRKKLEVLDAYNLFDYIIITDELGKEYWKPHPKAFEIMKEIFNTEYSQMMYIGDNPEKDFYISRFHPITTIRIIRENSIYDKANYREDIKEHFIIDTLHKINIILNFQSI